MVAVRTSKNHSTAGTSQITVRNGIDPMPAVAVETVPLSELTALDGMVIVTAKSYANAMIASALATKTVTGPLVIMQNGIGVERPFLESLPGPIYRCVLYATSQLVTDNEVVFRPIASSPTGIVRGTELELKQCVATLTTPSFRFHSELNLPKEIWTKAIINCVFNSICPLLDVDNGIFVRAPAVAHLAADLVRECIILAERRGIALTEAGLMDQVMKISAGSNGVLISTLQDIRSGRETEIEHLNLEMARIAQGLEPKVDLGKTKLLGKMILAKSAAIAAGPPHKRSKNGPDYSN